MNNDITLLPDGSAFFVASMPLPKDHWLFAPSSNGWDEERDCSPDTPIPVLDDSFRPSIRKAIQYAIRATTRNGTLQDFDPDALVQAAVYALCGPHKSVYTTEENKHMNTIHEDGQFHFFWNGVFSQWFPSEFVIETGNKVGSYDYGSITFNCAEQYMMFKKAALFGDKHTASLILQAIEPKVQKKLGREVQNFDLAVWEQECGKIVYDGNYAKFTQNPKLLLELMNTGNAILVEASPYDTVWGIGLDEATAKVTPVNEWKGTNWLGEVLTQLKLDLEWEAEKRLQSVGIEI